MHKPAPVTFPSSAQASRPSWIGGGAEKVVRLAFVSDQPVVDGRGVEAGRGLTDEEILAIELAELREQAETEGRAAGEAAGQRAYAEAVARVDALARDLAEARATMLHAMEGQLVDLALAVAGAVIEREVQGEAEYVVRLVREIFGLLGEADRVEVAVAPRDHALLQERAAALATEYPALKGIVVRVDPTIVAGCVVQTPRSLVDATVASRLANVAKAVKPMGIE